MKKTKAIAFRVFSIILLVYLQSFISNAQSISQPGEYMSYISNQCNPIMQDYMSYTSAVAHGKSAKKVDSKRQALMQSVKSAITKVSVMGPFKGDKSLRDSTVRFLKIYNVVLNEDYGKILNLEEIAEQSYDAMEAYLLAQDLASEKLKKANDDLSLTEKAFAKTNNVNIIEGGETELSVKLKKTGEVNKYHRVVYLIFFKSYKQELYMIDALKKKDINSVEQNKNSLIKFSDEGLAKLATIQPFVGDKSLVEACKQLLIFQNAEAKEKISKLTNFSIIEDNYNKEKKAFDAKKQEQRTQADVDQYNKAVNEYNQAINDYNKLNQELFEKRNTLINNWNKASENFFDKHVPKYK
jgi:hypothetical protein